MGLRPHVALLRVALLRRLFLTFCLVLCTGCSEVPVAQNLTQVQAIHIVSVLADGGIVASVVRERGVYRVVLATGSDYAAANQIISKQELLKDAGPTLSELLSSQGLLPSSREIESLRVDYALSLSLQEALEALPSVVMARVVVRSAFRGDSRTLATSSAVPSGPGVSVMLRTRPGEAKVEVSKIIEIVRRAVPGVQQEGITVSVEVDANRTATAESGAALSPQAGLVPFLLLWRVPAGEYKGIAVTMLAGIALALLVGVGCGLLAGRRRARAPQAASLLPVVMNPPAPKGSLRSVALQVGQKGKPRGF